MTYQAQFMRDRYALTATHIGQAAKKPASWMHKTAALLCAENAQRLSDKGKPMSDDHLKQRAVQLARAE